MLDATPEPSNQAAGQCQIFLDIYPSSEFSSDKNPNLPSIFAIGIASLFLGMSIVFFTYDRFIQYRNEKVVSAAARSNSLVSSLFPSNVRARLLAEKGTEDDKNKGRNDPNRSTLKGFLAGETQQDTEMQDADVYKSKPIADLFPETTVMFGDIVGK
jgi:hypothetical protein